MLHNTLLRIILATTYHDPEARLSTQASRTLPRIAQLFSGLAVVASPQVSADTLVRVTSLGGLVIQEDQERGYKLGLARFDALQGSLKLDPTHIFFCDLDRIMHWVEHFPEELEKIISQITAYDFLVLGRSARAFDMHPGNQRETEAIVNRVFAQITGCNWDVLAAARGFSRLAVEHILQSSQEETPGTDTVWPLQIRREARFMV